MTVNLARFTLMFLAGAFVGCAGGSKKDSKDAGALDRDSMTSGLSYQTDVIDDYAELDVEELPEATIPNLMDFYLDQTQIDEDVPVGTLLGSLIPADGDGDFSLVDGEGSDHNVYFMVQSRQLITNMLLSHHDNPILSVRVRFTKNSSYENVFEKIFQIYINDKTPPSPPKDLTYSLRGDSLVASPLISWAPTDDQDLSHYELAIGTTVGEANIQAWKNIGKISSTVITGLNLSSGLLYYVSIRSVDASGNVSGVESGTGWANLVCPEGYLKVFGNETPQLGGPNYTHGTKTRPDGSIRQISDFCVMKYEAKLRNHGVLVANGNSDAAIDLGDGLSASYLNAVSIPAGRPWVLISKYDATKALDAERACSNLGPGFSLVNNSEWQTVARQIETSAENWQQNTSAGNNQNTLNRGHTNQTDGTQSRSLESDESDNHYCIGIGSQTFDGNLVTSDCGGNWHINKRTHILSASENGIIWDFAGNVSEWVLDDNLTANHGSGGYIQAEPFSDDPLLFKLKWGSELTHTGKNGSHRGGLGYFGNQSLQGIIRGGWWNAGILGGIFDTTLNYQNSYTRDRVGFRCVFSP